MSNTNAATVLTRDDLTRDERQALGEAFGKGSTFAPVSPRLVRHRLMQINKHGTRQITGAGRLFWSTFAAAVHCDNCGHRAAARLSIMRHSVDMGDRQVIPANGPTKCGGCGSRAGTYRRAE